jgi:hypothetical protein
MTITHIKGEKRAEEPYFVLVLQGDGTRTTKNKEWLFMKGSATQRS